MFWRIGLGMLVIGGVLLVWGFFEWRLGRGASSKPERITLKQLIARGPAGNPNIILTDFELCDNYVYKEENGRWNGVYVPVVPVGEGRQNGGPARPTSGVKAILFSLNIHNQAEIVPVLGKRELPALVTNSIRSLGSDETKLLQETYGGLDSKKVLLIQECRKVMSGAILALSFGGGGALFLGGIGGIAKGIMGGRPSSAARPKGRPRDDDDEDRPRKRRRDDDDEDDDRPRKRRARDEAEEDDDDRPRKRRPRDEDEEDDPRPKRRRPRDEDDE